METEQHDQGPAVSWTASEFIAHQKSAGWYFLLLLAAAVVGALVYLITRDILSTAMVGVVAVILAILASRQPRTLRYSVDSYGIHVGERSYPYENFKSFSVQDEGAINSISLMPVRRFMPGMSMYYAPDDEEKIASVLTDYLPFEEHPTDFVDQLMKKIRF